MEATSTIPPKRGMHKHHSTCQCDSYRRFQSMNPPHPKPQLFIQASPNIQGCEDMVCTRLSQQWSALWEQSSMSPSTHQAKSLGSRKLAEVAGQVSLHTQYRQGPYRAPSSAAASLKCSGLHCNRIFQTLNWLRKQTDIEKAFITRLVHVQEQPRGWLR